MQKLTMRLLKLSLWITATASVINCVGCSSTLRRKYSFWNGFYLGAETDARRCAQHSLKEVCSNKTTRRALLRDLRQELAIRKLSFNDQRVAGIATAGIMLYENDHARMIKMVEDFPAQKAYLGALFFATSIYSPPYFRHVCANLAEYARMTVRLPDHDGSVKKVNLGRVVARNLRRATGKEFGMDQEAWLNWWDEVGSKLEFDWKKGRYPTGEHPREHHQPYKHGPSF